MRKQTMQVSAKGLYLSLIILAVLAVNAPSPAQEDADKKTDLTELSLDELINIEIASTATLTKTTPRLVPAAVTTITAEDIQTSGARSLFELLDIYVPNLEWLRHHWEPDALGLRGVINDRDDKYLLLVNGRNMNQRTHFGALSEQDLVLLQDIHHIDIVRGPGSALYGPGAVSMVINIVTYTADTFKGTETTARLGAVEEFYSSEIKHGQPFDDNDGGVLLYAGIGKYVGASKYDAPLIFPFSFPSGSPAFPWDGTEAGEPMTKAPVGRDGADARGLPAIKLHVQTTRDNWDIWARYTRGGKVFAPAVGQLAHWPYGFGDATSELSFYSYQQATGWIGYKQELTNNIDIDYAFSYDMLNTDKIRKGTVTDAFREDEYYGKALLRWQPNEKHSFAVGAELSHLELGLDSIDAPHHVDAMTQEFGSEPNMPRWSSNLYSLLGEWQWTINDHWTTFLGGRIDDHTFTNTMFSPRAAIVHTPTKIDTVKILWSRSVRANFEAEMKKQAAGPGSDITNPEKLDALELRYERQHTPNLDLAASLFLHYNLKVISWDNDIMRSVPIGTQKEYGIELEASYHTKDTRLTISHAYTKLLDFDLNPGQTTYITSEPHGFGHDLTNWSNHITKLTARHNLNDKWAVDGSLRIFWGFPGMKDYDEYYPYTGSWGETADASVIEDGWERDSRGSYYLNLGLQYKPSEDLTIGLNGYYLLGVFDKDLNKRTFIPGNGAFRSHSPAVAVSVSYKF